MPVEASLSPFNMELNDERKIVCLKKLLLKVFRFKKSLNIWWSKSAMLH